MICCYVTYVRDLAAPLSDVSQPNYGCIEHFFFPPLSIGCINQSGGGVLKGLGRITRIYTMHTQEKLL